MSWTFGNDPANSRLDRIRILIGDTNPQEPLLDDEFILWLLEQSTNDYVVAAQACQAIATRFAREADITVGDLSVKFSRMAEAYREAAMQLASQAGSLLTVALPIFTSSGQEPLFRIRQFDYKEAR